MLLGAALLLAGGFGMLALADEPSAQSKAAADAIKKLADDAGKSKWEDITKASADAAKKNELEDVMNLLKMRRPGAKVQGVGVGEKPGKITPDGIEAKIISMSKKAMPKATLEKEQADLIRMAEITAGVAATAAHQCPVPAKQGKKDPAKWKEWTKDMYESSQELIKALKDKNANAAKVAANKLNGTCTDCHGDFRD